MKRMVMVMMVVVGMLFAAVAWGQGWGTWTPEQKALVVDWVKLQPNKNPIILRDALLSRPVTNIHTWTETVSRDRWQALAENRAKAIAEQVGITDISTPAHLRAADVALTNWIATASAAAKPLRVYYANQFWTCVFSAHAVDGSGEDTETVTHNDPVCGPSQLELWSMPWACTCNDVKAALRAAGL